LESIGLVNAILFSSQRDKAVGKTQHAECDPRWNKRK